MLSSQAEDSSMRGYDHIRAQGYNISTILDFTTGFFALT